MRHVPTAYLLPLRAVAGWRSEAEPAASTDELTCGWLSAGQWQEEERPCMVQLAQDWPQHSGPHQSHYLIMAKMSASPRCTPE